MATHYESESVSHIAATYTKYHKVRSLNTVCNDLQLILVDHRTIPQTLLQTYKIADAGQLCCGTSHTSDSGNVYANRRSPKLHVV